MLKKIKEAKQNYPQLNHVSLRLQAQIQFIPLTVDYPAHAHLTQVEVTLALPRQLIHIVTTNPAPRALMQFEICLPALAATKE